MTCVTADEQFVTRAPARLLERLFFLCDGRHSLAALLDILGREWRQADVAGLVGGLLKNGILVDARDLGARIWPTLRYADGKAGAAGLDSQEIAELTRQENARSIESAPGDRVLPMLANPLNEALLHRRSAAAFSGEEIGLAALGSMLWSAYGVLPRQAEGCGIHHRTVPSAGAFHPLELFLLLLQPCETLAAGAYRVVYGPSGQVALRSLATRFERVRHAFVDPGVLDGARAVVVFAAAAGASARKYGGRAALYAALEAGHAIQNLLLTAGQGGVAAREVGGFFSDRMAKLLGLPAGAEAIASVACGVDAPAAADTPRFQWFDTERGEDGTDVVLGRAAQTVDGKQVHGWGYSHNADEAYAKAIAEVAERRACLQARGLEIGVMSELDGAVDPRTVAAYRPTQYRRPDFPYVPFDAKRPHAWKQGTDVEGRIRHVLADHVYFPEALSADGYAAYTAASSSGVAAHATLEAAFENAVMECLERDAFMCHWLNRIAPPQIATDSLPAEFIRQVHAFAENGTRLAVFDLSLDSVPVLMVAAQNTKQGFFTLGASAAFEPLRALSHAFAEVAFRAADFKRQPVVKDIIPAQVRSAADHGLLYRQRRHHRRADFLLRSPSVKTFASLSSSAPVGLKATLAGLGLSPILIDLSDKQSPRGIHVVRAVVPGLVPMSFGCATEPLACARIGHIRARFGAGAKSAPSVSSFPHPFA